MVLKWLTADILLLCAADFISHKETNPLNLRSAWFNAEGAAPQQTIWSSLITCWAKRVTCCFKTHVPCRVFYLAANSSHISNWFIDGCPQSVLFFACFFFARSRFLWAPNRNQLLAASQSVGNVESRSVLHTRGEQTRAGAWKSSDSTQNKHTGTGLKSPGEEGDLADWCRDGHWGRGGIFHLFVLPRLLTLEGCCVVNNCRIYSHCRAIVVAVNGLHYGTWNKYKSRKEWLMRSFFFLRLCWLLFASSTVKRFHIYMQRDHWQLEHWKIRFCVIKENKTFQT